MVNVFVPAQVHKWLLDNNRVVINHIMEKSSARVREPHAHAKREESPLPNRQ